MKWLILACAIVLAPFLIRTIIPLIYAMVVDLITNGDGHVQK